MKQKLLIATTNSGKFTEISNFLSDLPVQLVSLKEVGITDDVEEAETTYEANSKKKAIFYARKSGLPAISDDGGFEIEALNGVPGLRSKRWVGNDSTDEKIIEKMKQVAKELPDNNRVACFKTVVSFAMPNGLVFSSFGEVKGIIAKEPLLKLMHGYPYRSFFYIPKIKKFYHESELTPSEEKEYNHRYKAISKLIPTIRKVLRIK